MNRRPTGDRIAIEFAKALCAVTFLFVCLKVTDRIVWSWMQVLSPIWVPVMLIVLGLMVVICFGFVAMLIAGGGEK